MNEVSAMIVATKEKKEMHSKYSVFLHKICNRPMIDWTVKAVKEMGATRTVVVTESEELKNYLQDHTEFATTLEQAENMLNGETVLVTEGNIPGVTSSFFANAYQTYCKNKQPLCIKVGDERIAMIYQAGNKVDDCAVYQTEENPSLMPVVDRVSLSQTERAIYQRTALQLQLCGVTITNPEDTYISPDVTVGQDTVILPGCYLSGHTVIGEDCVIGPQTNLTNMKLGDRVTMKYTVGMDSEIGEDSTVGPFAYIRPNSKIGSKVKVGDFVEIKNSVIDTGTKISHLTYVGDSDVGAGVNFGCGTVTVNYDGVHKYRTTIGDKAFIGCNTNLVAPVTVAPEAFIAAGSTITEDIPEDCLAIARARQTNIQGWVSNRKEKNSK